MWCSCRSCGLAVEPTEALLFTPSILGSSKNASYDPASGRLGGTSATGRDAETLRAFIHRFSESAASLVGRLLPAYRDRIARGRASFRPAEIAGTPDDVAEGRHAAARGQLSGDAVRRPPHPARVQQREPRGARARVAPRRRLRGGRAPLRAAAARAAARHRPSARAGARDEDAAVGLRRADAAAARPHEGRRRVSEGSPQSRVDLPAGSTWLAFTDQVSHAATSGQYQLEQTFLLPVDAMGEPNARRFACSSGSRDGDWPERAWIG